VLLQPRRPLIDGGNSYFKRYRCARPGSGGVKAFISLAWAVFGWREESGAPWTDAQCRASGTASATFARILKPPRQRSTALPA